MSTFTEQWQGLGRGGLLGVGLPSRFGGQGGGATEVGRAARRLGSSVHDLSIGLSWVVHQVVSQVLIGKRGSDDEQFEVKPETRSLVLFRRLNLSTPPFPMKGPLDVVFCRNVMIYFDNKVRQKLVSEIERLLRPDGLLLIGHTETLTSLDTNFIAVKPSVYRKPLR